MKTWSSVTFFASETGLHVCRRRGEGDLRLEGAHVDRNGSFVFRAGVALEENGLPPGPALHVGAGGLVGLHDPVFRPRLDGHVRHREPVRHGKPAEGISAELESAVQRPLDADLADEAKDQVLSAHVRPQGSLYSTRIVGGTRSQISPVAITAAMSVLPTPVEKAPRAP